jgi:hypothetical protein
MLVDPALQSVQEITITDDTVATILRAINVARYDTALLLRPSGERDGVLVCVDDEGLLKELPSFVFAGYAHPLAGKALMLGVDARGESTDCPLTLQRALGLIQWCRGNVAKAAVQASQAISAAEHRAAGFDVETSQCGLVNVITRKAAS